MWGLLRLHPRVRTRSDAQAARLSPVDRSNGEGPSPRSWPSALPELPSNNPLQPASGGRAGRTRYHEVCRSRPSGRSPSRMSESSGSAVRRVVLIGGVSKPGLLSRLEAAAVRLNDLAHVLFADPRFTSLPAQSRVETVELTVADLGLPRGGTYAAILQQAFARGLAACPLELGPHLRLQYLDQPESPPAVRAPRNRAPPGSLTVVSQAVAADEDAPQGFYLRRISGSLWLRGYRSCPGHLWSPEDRLLLSVPGDAA